MTIVLDWPPGRRQYERLLEFCLRNGVDGFIHRDKKQHERIEADFFDRLVPFSLGKGSLERTVKMHGAQTGGEFRMCLERTIPASDANASMLVMSFSLSLPLVDELAKLADFVRRERRFVHEMGQHRPQCSAEHAIEE